MKKTERSAPRTRAAPGRVRIIGGRYRRTPIAVVSAPGLRPTPDRVRETIFNWLEHLLGRLDGTRVLDLFAGSGALGFEAASRGAGEVVLVEHSARACQGLRELQQRLGASVVQVLQDDWRAALARLPAQSFDIIFLDPPFAAGLQAAALRAVTPHLTPRGLIYAEGPAPLAEPALGGCGLEVVRSGHAGVVYFQLLHRQPC